MSNSQELHLPSVSSNLSLPLTSSKATFTFLFSNFHIIRCGETGDKAHTVSYCPKKLKNGIRRRSSDLDIYTNGVTDAVSSPDPLIPTPMVGHIINVIENLVRDQEQEAYITS